MPPRRASSREEGRCSRRCSPRTELILTVFMVLYIQHVSRRRINCKQTSRQQKLQLLRRYQASSVWIAVLYMQQTSEAENPPPRSLVMASQRIRPPNPFREVLYLSYE